MTVVSTPTITLDPSGNAPLAALVEFETTELAKVSLEVTAGSETQTIYFDDFATIHEVPLFGLKPDTAYTVKANYTGADGATEVAATNLEVTTEPLPDDFPTVNTLVSKPELMEPGYTMANPGGKALIVDDEGEVVWYTSLETMRNHEQLSGAQLGGAYDGEILVRDVEGYGIADLLTVVPDVVKIQGLDDLASLHHEMFVTQDNTLMTLGSIEVEVDGYPTSSTDPTPRDEPTLIVDEPVIEFDLDGNILNVWSLTEIIDPTRVSYDSHSVFFDAKGLDWTHNNAVITDPRDDTIIVSSRHQDAVIKFDRDGELVWILGTPDNWTEEYQPYLLEPVGEPFEWQYHQHAMEITADGNLLLFDNGNEKASPYDGTQRTPDSENYSRAVKYAIDEDTMQVSQVWEYVPDPSIYARAVGDADEQEATGNVLANFGFVSHVGGVSGPDLGKGDLHTRIIEVTPEADPEVVFDLEIFGSAPDASVTNYRADRMESLYGSDVSVLELIVGDNADNNLNGAYTHDEIRGLGGNDDVYGFGGKDKLLGGAGDDHLNGGENDDTLEGGDGNDGLYGREGDDDLHGDGGNDTLSGAWGDDTMEGGDGTDSLWGDIGNDSLYGGLGEDTLNGDEGDDHLNGGADDDILVGGDGNDGLYGREGNDVLQGDGGNDTLSGAWGDDTMEGGDGTDSLYGDIGVDSLDGGAGDDHLNGGSDDDTLVGGDGNDGLYGRRGNDVLQGGGGNDTLSGAWGDDTMEGGDGADIFSFVGGGFGQNVITDFALGEDMLVFNGVGTAGGPDDLLYAAGDFGGDGAREDIRITFAELADAQIDVLDAGSDIDALKTDMQFV